MISSLMFLQSFGYFQGGSIGNLLNQWQQAGVFNYMIPFLLIFALVFGILTRLNIFSDKNKEGGPNRTINAIIALAVALMALQFPTVPLFFATVFPALGIGLAVILVLLILTGLFIDPSNKGWMMSLSVIAVIVVLVVLLSSTWGLGFSFASWWNFYGGNAIALIIFIVMIVVIVAASSPKKDFKSDSLLAKALSGN